MKNDDERKELEQLKKLRDPEGGIIAKRPFVDTEIRKMTSKEELENLQAQIANLKEAEDKIRTVRQDLESDYRKLYHELNP